MDTIIEFYVNKKLIPEKYRTKIERRRKKLRCLCSNNICLEVLILSIPYMNKKSMRNFLIMNKQSYKIGKRKVFKEILIVYNEEMPLEVHSQIWGQIFDIVMVMKTIRNLLITILRKQWITSKAIL